MTESVRYFCYSNIIHKVHYANREKQKSKPHIWGKCKFITVIPRHLEVYDPGGKNVAAKSKP
jgi:hypothetical protein